MNDRQENRNTRGTNLVTFFRENQPALSANQAVLESFNKILGIQTEVASQNQFILGGRKGTVLAKAEARNELVIPGVVLAGAIFSLGRDEKNFDLQTRASVNESEIAHNARDTELSDILGGLLSEANLNITKMPKYQITPEFLTDFEAKLITYNNSIGTKNSRSDAIKLAGEKIDSLQSQLAEIIHKDLDKRMQVFRLSTPDLYDKYLLAARLSEEGIRHEEEEETVTGETPAPGGTTPPADNPGQ